MPNREPVYRIVDSPLSFAIPIDDVKRGHHNCGAVTLRSARRLWHGVGCCWGGGRGWPVPAGLGGAVAPEGAPGASRHLKFAGKHSCLPAQQGEEVEQRTYHLDGAAERGDGHRYPFGWGEIGLYH